MHEEKQWNEIYVKIFNILLNIVSTDFGTLCTHKVHHIIRRPVHFGEKCKTFNCALWLRKKGILFTNTCIDN